MAYFFGLRVGADNEINNIETPSANTIEWTLSTPVSLHAFNSLPVQS